MLFLIVSTPRAERPSEVAAARQSFWSWIGAYQASGVCRHIYPRAGRGAVAILDLADHTDLNRLLNEWAEIIPATFDTYPLVDVAATEALLAAQLQTK